MKNNYLNKALATTKRSIVKHSPEILTGIGITGFVSAIIFAVRATPLAIDAIEEKKEELNTTKLSPVDTVKAAGKYYIPTAVIAVTSGACVIGGQKVNAKRNAALATAYGLSEAAFKEYKDKVIETIGEKKEKAIQEEVYKERIEKNPPEQNYIYNTGFGDCLCYDALSGRYFRSNINTVEQAYKNVAEMISEEDYASFNDWGYELNLPANIVGTEIGWNSQKLPKDSYGRVVLESSISTQRAIGGEPCLVLDFVQRPTENYRDLH